MNAIWAVTRKEFRAYFDSAVAYVFLSILLTICAFLFFFLFLFQSNEADLRDFFWLFPPLFTIFVPAVAMRLWAEERHRGTFEVLLTLPVPPWQVVLGKFLGALLFLAATLSLTLPVPLTVAYLGDPDHGPIWGGYLGALLLSGAYLGIGTAASALTRSQIVAFLLGFLCLLGLFLVGSPAVLAYLPGPLKAVGEAMGLGAHFEGMRRGVIDTRDLVYYLSITVLALFVTALAVESQRWRRGARANALMAVAFAVILAGLTNFFAARFPVRWDLTQDKAFSVSEGSRKAISGLKDLVIIRFVRSADLPEQLIGISRRIEDTLMDLAAVSGGMVRLDAIEVGEDETERREARTTGVPEIRVDVVGSDRREQRPVFFGVAVSYGDRGSVLPFVQDTQFLEYDLVAAILKVSRDKEPRVVFLEAKGSRQTTGKDADYGPIRGELEKRYSVGTHDCSNGRPIPDDTTVLVVAGPEGLSEREVYEIDQFAMHGGRVLFLVDAIKTREGLTGADRRDAGLDSLLASLGVRVNPDIVADVSRAMAQFSSDYGNVRQVNFVQYACWPMLRREFVDQKHPVVARLDGVVLPWPSSIDTVAPTSGGEAEVASLLKTTPQAWRMAGPNYDLNPFNQQGPAPSTVGQRTLAVAVTGRFASAFKGKGPPAPTAEGSTPPSEDATRKTVEQCEESNRAVVIGDSDFLAPPWVGQHAANPALFLNAVDWLAAEDALIGIRSRTARSRTFGEVSDRTRTVARTLNLLIPAMLIVAIGLVRMAWRGHVRRRIKEDLGR